ncbi:MAG: hypothetical protein COW24_00835 [Candidatus Kerfeldbacteria bacterium CG15_BIG_FIL_POST_REV_8_21_14_020_45_12]|uniref:DUF5667 domain-containing protein n=1 Tax=Candidatus Kerfeldbacteria bacterium CG15_BIG_FIL_POST_REV_8_21_14_020_45_12 TaxID=2014247 RepID=A0A2M7H511_9BACT|nr:MAG: hypothetical protein COW24_00835 [Candidatus Kerfeldbacteria bacterium CG15_BIG_FIL_POST_REV_8_21_14_020_45_12]PJA93188.1 MAG: hypothetical protein CO132_04370 [Candidatus Kerfeldbacteria bacterium CG_4_9_14_3_um_filter_45_8]
MKKSTLTIVAAAVGIALTAGITTALASSDSGDTFHSWMMGSHDQIETAINDGDYETWSALSLERNTRLKEEADAKVTPDNFQTLQEVHRLHESGDNEAARELMMESGLHMGMGGPGHNGPGRMGQAGPKGQPNSDNN